MALNIKDRRTDALARRAAELRQSGITQAVRAALERDIVELEKERERRLEAAGDYLRRLQARMAATPDRDTRPLKELRDWLWSDED